MELLRDPNTGLLNTDFFGLLQKWSLESMSYIALNRRLGLLGDTVDDRATKFANNISLFFYMSYLFDILPSVWPYYHTRKFKEFLKIYDEITESCLHFIEEARADKEAIGKGIFGQLMKINKQVALVMAIDMLMAGIDTVR